MTISTAIFIGLVLLFVICIARTIAGQIDDLKHQYETRIVQLDDGRYQVEEFNYDSADLYGENCMVWWPMNAIVSLHLRHGLQLRTRRNSQIVGMTVSLMME